MNDKIKTVENAIVEIVDFPQKGIVFKDLIPIFENQKSFNALVDVFVEKYQNRGFTKVVAIESRGFFLAPVLAHRLNVGFVPIRKKGKLPGEVYNQEYELEYGTDIIEIHKESLQKGDKVILHDDLLATGGTMEAAIKLLQRIGVDEISVSFIVELGFLNGRKKLINAKELFVPIKY